SKEEIKLSGSYQKQDINPDVIREFSNRAGETGYRLYDFPSSRQVKIYYKDATLMVDLEKGEGLYEKISRRPVFYEVNVLHRNSVDWWKWASDLFAVTLIVITITGMLMLRGSNGLAGRGKWFIAAGLIPPLVALVAQQL
ncbi:MAG: PepSY-associated TM helix domain-containing protein, partial [Chlorobiales bacterium]|nr:PepSY-associated TM helix domain-containing protein [Chlorobiales bacterium]